LALWRGDGHRKLVTHFGVIGKYNERFGVILGYVWKFRGNTPCPSLPTPWIGLFRYCKELGNFKIANEEPRKSVKNNTVGQNIDGTINLKNC